MEPAEHLAAPVSHNSKPGCLTQVQADALRDYIRPIMAGHKIVIPGYPITDLGGPDGMTLWFLGSAAPTNPGGPEPWAAANTPFGWSFADQTLKYLVYLDPSYNIFNFDLDTRGEIGSAALRLYDRMTQAGNADDPKALLPHLARGGKLLMYHGFSDGGLSPFRTIRFYKELAELAGGYRNVQRHARLFMVPKMHHCAGGPGPNVFDPDTAAGMDGEPHEAGRHSGCAPCR